MSIRVQIAAMTLGAAVAGGIAGYGASAAHPAEG